MLRIPRKVSTTISLIFVGLFFAVLITCAVLLPQYALRVCSYGVPYILAVMSGYGMLVLAAAANVFLCMLLLRVRQGQVFTGASIGLVRGVSWCCILFSVFLGLLGAWITVCFAVAFAVLFLGICLRVVKNVIEEATEIKHENDLTV